MSIGDFIGTKWRRRFWVILSLFVVMACVSHPELRLLLIMVDLLGVDVVIGLLGLQLTGAFSGYVRPFCVRCLDLLVWCIRAADRMVRSVALLREIRSLFSYGMFHWTGRPEAWFRIHAFLHAGRAGT